MSDLFINTIETMPVGDSVVYYAASPESRDKLIKLLNMQEFSITVEKQGARHFKITVYRKARFFQRA